MTPEQLIERLDKRIHDEGAKPHLIEARSKAAEAWRLPAGDRRYELILEAQALMKGAQQ